MNSEPNRFFVNLSNCQIVRLMGPKSADIIFFASCMWKCMCTSMWKFSSLILKQIYISKITAIVDWSAEVFSPLSGVESSLTGVKALQLCLLSVKVLVTQALLNDIGSSVSIRVERTGVSVNELLLNMATI